jgi:hypothetical protein
MALAIGARRSSASLFEAIGHPFPKFRKKCQIKAGKLPESRRPTRPSEVAHAAPSSQRRRWKSTPQGTSRYNANIDVNINKTLSAIVKILEERGLTGRSESMKPEHTGVSDMSDVLARIESALQRSEAAAERLGQRQKGLRSAARDTLAGLDRLLQADRRRADG